MGEFAPSYSGSRLAQFNLQSVSAVWRQNAVPLCYNEQEELPLIKI
jgi:hypothetical protein